MPERGYRFAGSGPGIGRPDRKGGAAERGRNCRKKREMDTGKNITYS